VELYCKHWPGFLAGREAFALFAKWLIRHCIYYHLCQVCSWYYFAVSVKNVNDDMLQASAARLVNWTRNNRLNGVLINVNKTKELLIRFSKKVNVNDIPRLWIHGNDIEKVSFNYVVYSLVQICHGTAMLRIYFKKLKSNSAALFISWCSCLWRCVCFLHNNSLCTLIFVSTIQFV